MRRCAWSVRWPTPPGATAAHFDVVEPVLEPVVLAAHDGEEGLLQRLGDRARLTAADGAVVDRADRHDLGRGAGEERLVGEVDVGATEEHLAHRVAEVAGDLDDRRGGDARERTGRRHRRHHEPTVADEEEVLAGSLGEVAVGREHQRLVVAGTDRFDLGERGVDVHPRRLRRGRHRPRVVPRPRAHLQPDPVGHPVVAEVGAPRPDRDRRVGGADDRVEAHLAVPVVDERADVAALDAARGDGLAHRSAQLLFAERHLHRQQVRRTSETGDVLAQAEDRRAATRRIGPDAFEHRRAVVQAVREDMDLGVVPVDELSVHPNLRRRG